MSPSFPRDLRGGVRGVLALGVLVAACASESSAPRLALEPDALVEHLRPAEGDEAVVVNFWATWCPPCVAEMPELVELHHEVAGRGVRVVAVSIDVPQPVKAETPEEVFAFADERGFDLPIVALSTDFDGLQAIAERYDLPGGIPFTFVVDADGEVVARQEGAADLAHFRSMVAQATGEAP